MSYTGFRDAEIDDRASVVESDVFLVADTENVHRRLQAGLLSPVGHTHETEYAALSHVHDYSSVYAALSHVHDGIYAPVDFENQSFNLGGRLSLVSGVPLHDNIAGGKSATLYYTPFLHDWVEVWYGSAWKRYQFTELSLDLSGLSYPYNYDIFLSYDDGLLLSSQIWSTDTSRVSGNDIILSNDGRWVSESSKSLLYLGTIRIATAEGVSYSVVSRMVWNMKNRVFQSWGVGVNLSSWTTSSTSWEGLVGGSNYKFEYLSGMSKCFLEGLVMGHSMGYDGGFLSFGFDSFSPVYFGMPAGFAYAGDYSQMSFCCPFQPGAGGVGVGFHYIGFCQKASTGMTATFLSLVEGHLLTTFRMFLPS